MSKAKDQLARLLEQQPDDSSYEELIREMAFSLMVKRGLNDSDKGQVISNEEMQHRIRTWQK